ncbi:target of Myb protein 1 [Notothenia coriiceps]|uniref:Target of Myb protein 1 n=1 Tax=Notothenia coriiceps TaxID=8208 RepID=A0A6I9N7X8_9TELE|nr:PREDICTED: target of Myb protein 1 [Notothenia coriiceps]
MFSLGEKIEFFIGNPFSTPVGQRIERATSVCLQSEDWGINMEICDIINETDEGPKDAVKAIKKRIVGNKNFREIMLALTVLEACVKNCGQRFHILVSSQEFIEGVLVRSILPKYNPPIALHDRVLSLIQSWADAFRSSPSLAGVVYVYDDLRRRGLEFPMTDLDALSPIHTPNRSTPENETPETAPAAVPTPQSEPQPASSVPPQITSPPDQRGEEPGSLSAQQVQLHLKNPVSQCLHGTGIVRFDRLNKVQVSNTPQQSFSTTTNLLDLSPESPSLSQPDVITTTSLSADSAPDNQHQSANHKEEEEFDMFAHTRGSSLADQRKSVRYEDPGAVEGLAGALDTRLQVTGGVVPAKNSMQSDVDRSNDMEEHSSVSEGVSSEEFDKFLEDRAKESDHSAPTIRSVPASTLRPPPQSARQQEKSDQLFSL